MHTLVVNVDMLVENVHCASLNTHFNFKAHVDVRRRNKNKFLSCFLGPSWRRKF